MSRIVQTNSKHKARPSGQEDIEITMEEGSYLPSIITDQQSPQSYLQQQTRQVQTKRSSRFLAGDDDTEAPPVPRRRVLAPDPPAQKGAPGPAAIAQASPRRRKELQLAPAMEPGALGEAHATSSAARARSPRVTYENVPHHSPAWTQQPATVQPGAVRVSGNRRSRRNHFEEDHDTIMTPIAAEVVQDTPLAVAIPAPQDVPREDDPDPPQQMPLADETAPWWTKPRNRKILIAASVTIAIVVAILVAVVARSASRGGGGGENNLPSTTSSSNTPAPTSLPTFPTGPTTTPVAATNPSSSPVATNLQTSSPFPTPPPEPFDTYPLEQTSSPFPTSPPEPFSAYGPNPPTGAPVVASPRVTPVVASPTVSPAVSPPATPGSS